MLIDTSNLNINKTYQCNEIGTSEIAQILQALEHKKYPEFNKSELASHSFALYYKNGSWMVWENHLKWKGVREYSLEEYENDNKNASEKRIEVNQYDFDLDSFEYLKNNNPGYSVLDLAKIASKRIIGIRLPNTPGMVCSESIAHCGFKICNSLKIKADYITPADWQYYFFLKIR